MSDDLATGPEHMYSRGEFIKTPILQRQSGEPIGASIFLNYKELRSFGIDLENDNEIYYKIEQGDVVISRSLNG